MRRKLIFIVLPLVLGSCSLAKQEENKLPKITNIPEVDHEYFEVEKFYINWSDILFQNKKSYYVYVFSLTCSHCQELKNWIIEEALKRDDIFFVKGTSKIPTASNVSSTIGSANIENISILGYPTLLKIDDKILIKNVAGITKIKDLLSIS